VIPATYLHFNLSLSAVADSRLFSIIINWTKLTLALVCYGFGDVDGFFVQTENPAGSLK